MEGTDIAKLVMNPVRMRIVQYLIMNETGTASQIKEKLNDIPPASLYRHLRVLAEGGCIQVVEERKVRGTVEKTYSLIKEPFGEYSKQNAGDMIQSMLLSLTVSFGKYFARQDSDPVRDGISLSTSTLLLTDQEFMEMTGKLGEVFNQYIGNQPAEGRKQRRMTFISSPCEEEKENEDA